MGRKLAELARSRATPPLSALARPRSRPARRPACYPGRAGLVFAALGLPERDAFAVHQYGIATMMLSAALRLMRIDHLDTQRSSSSSTPRSRRTTTRPPRALDDMAAFAPVIDVLAAVHVQAHVRLFMN